MKDGELTEEQVRWFRLRRSGLVEPFASPEEAASALVGVQAQILPAAGVSLWNRTDGRLTYERFDSLLHEERRLIKLWGQRHTLHLYPSGEWPLIHGALSGQQKWWEREVEKGNVEYAHYPEVVAQAEVLLRERGTLGRSDLRESDLPLDPWHLSAWGGLFSDLVRQGYACHAGQMGNEGRFAHREHWLPDLEWNPPPPAEANQEIVRRYLRAYGPATLQDFAYWRGTQAATARKWFAALGDEVAEVDVAGQPMLARRADLDALAAAPPERDAWPIHLLYRFDPLLLGLRDKSWIVDPPFTTASGGPPGTSRERFWNMGASRAPGATTARAAACSSPSAPSRR